MSTIKVENLTKNFGNLQAVNAVDMSVNENEVLCLLGPSGCGKTTTLRIIAGLEQENFGDVYIGGNRVNELLPSERDIAMVFQFYALYPTLTVEENIGFPLRSENIGEAEAVKRVNDVVRALQLHDVIKRTPSQLSEGEKQRVSVARAVVRNPNCFLFDEPLSRLDVTMRQSMRSEIKEILNGLSKATIIVSHDQIEALTMADRIAVMRAGRIEQIATPHEIFTKPANLFVAGFIGTPAMNLIPSKMIACDGNRVCFDLCGQRANFVVQPAVSESFLNSSVTVGIRPRAFQLQNETSDDGLSATIDLIEPMGAETLVHVISGGVDIRVVLNRSQKVSVGEKIHLMVKPNQTLVFDKNERLISS